MSNETDIPADLERLVLSKWKLTRTLKEVYEDLEKRLVKLVRETVDEISRTDGQAELSVSTVQSGEWLRLNVVGVITTVNHQDRSCE
ncbi:MAG: hypothetical protein R3F65_25595 [bacterium]